MKRGLVILGLLCALTLSACAGIPRGPWGSSPPPWAIDLAQGTVPGGVG